MIQDELELGYAYENLAKMYRLKESSAQESLWHPEGRKDAVDSIEDQIQQIEREVAAYLKRKYASTSYTDPLDKAA
jgi:DNA primase large subunit